MRFLLDQDVPIITARFLQGLGHDVLTAEDAGCARTPDVELLQVARKQDRLLVTRDRHFGSLVFLRKAGSGVIYLRVLPSEAGDVHDELARLLADHSEHELRQAFVVVEPGKHRFRQLS